MGRRTILTQKEMEAFIKNPPIGFISLGAGLILPCIFLGDIIPYYMVLLFVIIGIVSLLVGMLWLLFRLDIGSDNHTGTLDFNVRTRGNETYNYISHLSKTNKKIANNSNKIKALTDLNKQYLFKSYQPTQTHSHICASKREFDRIRPRDFFYKMVYNQFYSYEKIIECIKYNRTEYKTYLTKVSEIESLESTTTEELCEQLKIGIKKFKRREKKLFKKLTQTSPEHDISIYCEITYTSPQGRNNYRNNAVFSFSDLQSIYERVKRQKAEQETKEYKIKHERSKMSASLRYDILKRDNFKCQICGATKNDGVKLHVDHIVPVSKGGKTEWSNLRTLCERCNLGKSDKSEIQVSQSSISSLVDENESWNIGDVLCNAKKYSKQEWAYWNGAVKYFHEYSQSNDYSLIWELANNVWNDKDHEVYAYDLYLTIDHAIYYLYPFREQEGATDMIIDLGYKGLSVVDGYIAVAHHATVWMFPSKLAILLEKSDRISEAIELCDFCISRGITDTNHSTFEERKHRLAKKLK